jgi:membrane protein
MEVLHENRPSRRQKSWGDRGRVIKTLTFWLRPAFAIRVLGRFQRIAGFDRAIALASSAMTGLLPLALIVGAVVGRARGKDIADWIVERYELSGAGAAAVEDAFAPAGGTETSVGLIGALFLLLAALSFTRAVQRLFEQTWELKPLGVRNSGNGLRWLGVLFAYGAAVAVVHVLLDGGRLGLGAALLLMPLTALFLVWGGHRLSAKRIDWHDLVPFGVIAGVLSGLYSVGASLYVPHQFDSFAARYGVIGAVLAIISTLFCLMVVIVGSAAAGREVHDELQRIRRGDRPPDDEVRREWDAVVADARSRWRSVRQRTERRRGPAA